MGAIFAHAVGDASAATAEAIASGMRIAFQIAAFMAAAAFLMALTTLRRHATA
jgi:hypothetical protein